MGSVKKLIGTGAVLALAAAGCGYLLSREFDLKKYTVSSEKIPVDFDGMKILQLSDFHNRDFGKKSGELLRIIDNAAPDIIVFTGDMADRKRRGFGNFLSLCKTLCEKYQVFYTLGNHELYYSDEELSGLFSEMKKIGAHILNNEKIKLVRGNSSIDLYGMWCGLHFYKDQKLGHLRRQEFTLDELNRLLGSCNSQRFSILLAHNPLYFPVYAEWGADLIFAGHVHGGLVELPKIGGVFSPERKFFPQYYGGKYSSKGSEMIVSRGLGGMRMLKAEITLTTLKGK